MSVALNDKPADWLRRYAQGTTNLLGAFNALVELRQEAQLCGFDQFDPNANALAIADPVCQGLGFGLADLQAAIAKLDTLEAAAVSSGALAAVYKLKQ